MKLYLQDISFPASYQIHASEQWIKWGLVNFISEAKSVSNQDVLFVIKCNDPKSRCPSWLLIPEFIESISSHLLLLRHYILIALVVLLQILKSFCWTIPTHHAYSGTKSGELISLGLSSKREDVSFNTLLEPQTLQVVDAQKTITRDRTSLK